MDYSALEKNYTSKDIKQTDKSCQDFINSCTSVDYPKWNLILYKIFIIVTYTLLVVLFLLNLIEDISKSSYSDNVNNYLTILLICSFFGFIFLYFKYDFNNKKIKFYCYYQFIKDNKLFYFYKTGLDKLLEKNDVYLNDNGLIYSPGHSYQYVDIFGDSTFSFGNLKFITGSGKYKQTHRWIVGTIKLSRNLPHVVLDAKANDNFGMSSLPEKFKNNQKVNAESALNDHFTLYTPGGYTIDALSFIAPDLIDVLINRFGACDIEIIDNSLNIYYMGIFNKKDLKSWFQEIQALAYALEDNIDNYRDTRINKNDQKIEGLDLIAPAGRRLIKSKRNIIITIVAIIVINILYVCVQFISYVPEARKRDIERQSDINLLRAQLWSYEAKYGNYPTFTDFNSLSWRNIYMPSLNPSALCDPLNSSNPQGNCALASYPTPKMYAYQTWQKDGKTTCSDHATQTCLRYTLTASYESSDFND